MERQAVAISAMNWQLILTFVTLNTKSVIEALKHDNHVRNRTIDFEMMWNYNSKKKRQNQNECSGNLVGRLLDH